MTVNILKAGIKNRKYQQRHKKKTNRSLELKYTITEIKVVTEWA